MSFIDFYQLYIFKISGNFAKYLTTSLPVKPKLNTTNHFLLVLNRCRQICESAKARQHLHFFYAILNPLDCHFFNFPFFISIMSTSQSGIFLISFMDFLTDNTLHAVASQSAVAPSGATTVTLR